VTLTGQGGRIFLQFLGVVILARLLSPRDYGLIAIVVVIIGVGEIFRDFGLSSAAVRSPELTKEQSSNLFWINAGIGLVLGAALFAVAGPLAAASGQPKVYAITHALSTVLVLNGLTTQFRALLLRGLRFRWLASTDVLASAVALGAAIVTALLGWGYWALVTQQIVQALMSLAGAILGTRWIPGRLRGDVSVRSFLHFGANLVLTQLINYGTSNVDTAVVGFAHGATPLGLYNRAYQLVVSPLNQIQSPITSVAIPILAKIQDDQARFSAYVVRGQLALGYPITLGLGVVVAAAQPITELLLGAQWDAAVPLLQLFAIAGIARTLASVGYWVYVVRGLSGALFRYTLVTGSIRVVCVLAGSHWGVVGVATGMAIAPWVAWPISLLWLSRATTIPTRQLYAGALRIVSVGLLTVGAASVVMLLLPTLPALVSIAVTCLVFAGVVAILYAVPIIRGDVRALREVVQLVRARKA